MRAVRSGVPQLRLVDAERQQLTVAALAAVTSVPKGDAAALVGACRELAPGVRARLARLSARIDGAMRGGDGTGVLHLIGLPAVAEPAALSILLACMLGDPVKEHEAGPWLKHIWPEAGESLGRPSARDSREFFPHTDLSYSASPPSFFLLHSLCNNPAEAGRTTLCAMSVLTRRVTEASLAELARPQFYFPTPSYYPGSGTVVAAVVGELDDGRRSIRFRRDGLRASSFAAMAAVLDLLGAIDRSMVEIHLDPNTALIIDNRLWLHGRTAFLHDARSGTPRHLHQVYAL